MLYHDPTNCGACGAVCTAPAHASPLCALGSCEHRCLEGWGDCDGELGNGCESDLSADTSSCGACGRACSEAPHSTPSCVAGTCDLVCEAGFVFCGSELEEGCVDTLVTREHCGGCVGAGGVACAEAEDCIDGVCLLLWEGVRQFSNCGGTGRTGPTQAQCDAAYAGTNLASEVTVTGGIQQWVVPSTGTYRIEAFGAQGNSAQAGRVGGRGARIRGDFRLDEGTVLRILVGHAGTGDGCSGGGGGGSFVVLADNTPLLVAGGGAGTRSSVSRDGCPGRVEEVGGTGSRSSDSHSCAAKSGSVRSGGIVSSGSWGSGAGGFDGDGGSDCSGTGGQAFVRGATGGSGAAAGGFGCGGSGNGCCGGGGGGGYSGGDGGRVAGAGGSFNSGENREATPGARESHGLVTIDLVRGE